MSTQGKKNNLFYQCVCLYEFNLKANKEEKECRRCYQAPYIFLLSLHLLLVFSPCLPLENAFKFIPLTQRVTKKNIDLLNKKKSTIRNSLMFVNTNTMAMEYICVFTNAISYIHAFNILKQIGI